MIGRKHLKADLAQPYRELAVVRCRTHRQVVGTVFDTALGVVTRVRAPLIFDGTPGEVYKEFFRHHSVWIDLYPTFPALAHCEKGGHDMPFDWLALVNETKPSQDRRTITIPVAATRRALE